MKARVIVHSCAAAFGAAMGYRLGGPVSAALFAGASAYLFGVMYSLIEDDDDFGGAT